jgi:BirA family biotin operon repressor/biotin-[acetyl-CoA-carboxylase] ligase
VSHSHNTPEKIILTAMLKDEQDWVSGALLAKQLKLSRVAIWNHMEKLRAQGFEFESRRSLGYRIKTKPQHLNAVLMQLYLKAKHRNFSFDILEEIDSTNDEVARQLAAGREAPFALFARRQTKGRGRFGRTWHSESETNIYVSFGFRPMVAPDRMQTFTLWMGVNICDLIASYTKTSPQIKWPNDLVFDGKKAGGILTEARIDADQIRDLVFGLGLNVNRPAKGWPVEIEHRAIALGEVAGVAIDYNRLASALSERIIEAYHAFGDGTHLKTFADLWNRYDVLRGKKVALIEADRRISGTVMGIDDHGALLLKDHGGKTRRFRAGEVTIEK